VKSVLGEFISGVSIRRNKHTRSDLGPSFCPGPHPDRGVRGPLPPALYMIHSRSDSFLLTVSVSRSDNGLTVSRSDSVKV